EPHDHQHPAQIGKLPRKKDPARMLAVSILVDYRISENPAAQISSAAHDPRNWHPHNYDNSRPKEIQRLVALRNVRPAQVSGPSDRASAEATRPRATRPPHQRGEC